MLQFLITQIGKIKKAVIGLGNNSDGLSSIVTDLTKVNNEPNPNYCCLKKNVNVISLTLDFVKKGAEKTGLYNLPQGYRPSVTLYIPCLDYTSGTFTFAKIGANGYVDLDSAQDGHEYMVTATYIVE